MQRAEERQPAASDIERAVGIEKPHAALFDDTAPEAEVIRSSAVGTHRRRFDQQRLRLDLLHRGLGRLLRHVTIVVEATGSVLGHRRVSGCGVVDAIDEFAARRKGLYAGDS